LLEGRSSQVGDRSLWALNISFVSGTLELVSYRTNFFALLRDETPQFNIVGMADELKELRECVQYLNTQMLM